ncbi:hypothetical protein LCGC14_2850080, partial [marine sediment metagenome]
PWDELAWFRVLPLMAKVGSVLSGRLWERISAGDSPLAQACKADKAQVLPGRKRHNEGHGRRLTAAFEALEGFPALAESRKRVLHVVSQDQPSVGDMVSAIESDVALVIAVMRLANKHASSRGRIRNVPEAIEVLTPAGVEALIGATKTFDFFERTPQWDAAPEQFRLHGVATQRAADRLAARVGFPDRDELLVSSLLHDVGKLVLVQAYPGYPGEVHISARTPEQRIHSERRELGIDHALVGGVMARRWGLPQVLAAAIEHHHAEEISGEAALVRLADMFAHYAQGQPVAPDQLLAGSRSWYTTLWGLTLTNWWRS